MPRYCLGFTVTFPPDSFMDACNSNSIIIDAGESRVVASTAGIAVIGNLTVNGNVSVTGHLTAHGITDLNG